MKNPFVMKNPLCNTVTPFFLDTLAVLFVLLPLSVKTTFRVLTILKESRMTPNALFCISFLPSVQTVHGI